MLSRAIAFGALMALLLPAASRGQQSNVLVSRRSAFGPFPASYQFGFGVYAAHPEVGPSWKIRSAIVLLLPRGK
jgi:hypothetical protein